MSTSESPSRLEANKEGIQESTLLFSIWLRPTATLRYILAHCPDKYLVVLLALGGVARGLNRAIAQSAGDKMSLAAVLILAIVVGGASGYVIFYLYSVALSFTGRWLGGRADWESIRIVVAWALVPSIVRMLSLLPQLVIFGHGLFKSEPEYSSAATETLELIFALLDVVLTTWTLVLLVQGIRLLQGYSIGKAIVNLLLPGVLLLSVIMLFVGAVKLFTWASQIS